MELFWDHQSFLPTVRPASDPGLPGRCYRLGTCEGGKQHLEANERNLRIHGTQSPMRRAYDTENPVYIRLTLVVILKGSEWTRWMPT